MLGIPRCCRQWRGRRTGSGPGSGIVPTEGRFPGIPGEVGNASTFDFPVRLRRVVVPGAESHELEEDARAIPAYVAAARELDAFRKKSTAPSSNASMVAFVCSPVRALTMTTVVGYLVIM